MNYQRALTIQNRLYQIRDGIYIGKYNLPEAKIQLQTVIDELFTANAKGQSIAKQLQATVLP